MYIATMFSLEQVSLLRECKFVRVVNGRIPRSDNVTPHYDTPPATPMRNAINCIRDTDMKRRKNDEI